MNKKVFSLCLGAVLLLLASCSGGYSSKEIDGVEFTGEGVFGDVPYICMDFLKEFNESFKAKVLDGSVTEAEREELREDCRSRYEEIKKKEIVNVPFELHINGKVVLNSELKLKLKDYDPIISECYAFYTVEYPEEYHSLVTRDQVLYTLLLDKDDQILLVYNGSLVRIDIGKSDPYVKPFNWDALLKDNQARDRMVKVLFVDEEEYVKLMNKQGLEASKKADAGIGCLSAFDLKGNVKICLEKNEMGESRKLEFDNMGKLIKCDGNPAQNIYSKMKFDDNGRLVSAVREENYSIIETTYEYDTKTGHLIKQKDVDPEGQMVTTYTYDENGLVTKKQEVGEFTEMGAEEPMKLNRTSIYTYPAIDAQGNWTKRQVESEGAMITEVRSISYF